MFTPNYSTYRPQVQPQYTWQQPIYQPQQVQMPQAQQPTMVQQPVERVAQTIQPLPIQSIRFLTADEIKAYIVMPNSKEMLIDKANGIAYIKMADNMGQSSTEKYRFEQITEEDNNVSNIAQNEPKIDTSNFVTKDMLDGFVKTDDLTKLSAEIDKLQKKIKINDILSSDKKEIDRGE